MRYFIPFFVLIDVILATGETLSCDRAVELSLSSNHQLLRSAAAQDEAYWQHWEASGNMLPSANLGYTHIWNDKEVSWEMPNFEALLDPNAPDDAPETISSVILPETQWQRTLDVTWPFFTGGSIFSAQRMASINHDIARLNHHETTEQVKLNVLEAYYELVRMEGVLNITETARDLVIKNLEMVTRMLELGMVQKRDLLRTEVSAREIEQQIQQARMGVRLARINLNRVLGEPLDKVYSVDAMIPDVHLHLSQTELYEHARDHRAGYQATLNVEDLARWGVRASRGTFVPSITGVYHWQRDSEVSLTTGDNPESWRVILNVGFELPIGFTNLARYQQARAQYRQAQYGIQQAEDGLRLEVEANHQSFLVMEESLRLAVQRLTAAEEVYAAVNAAYEEGDANLLELLDSRNSLTQARINQVITRVDRYLTYNRLMVSCGYTVQL